MRYVRIVYYRHRPGALQGCARHRRRQCKKCRSGALHRPAGSGEQQGASGRRGGFGVRLADRPQRGHGGGSRPAILPSGIPSVRLSRRAGTSKSFRRTSCATNLFGRPFGRVGIGHLRPAAQCESRSQGGSRAKPGIRAGDADTSGRHRCRQLLYAADARRAVARSAAAR